MGWELGLLSGVARSGVDLTGVDLTVGTSAGSAVGVWFRSGAADADVLGRLEATGAKLPPAIPEADYVSLYEELVGNQWPAAFLCTVTDVESGEQRTLDHCSGVPLAQAIAASCAWPGFFPQVTIAGRRYMDGGLHDGVNLQLAAGYDTVIAFSCRRLATTDDMLPETVSRMRNTREALATLSDQGARVVFVEPDEEFLTVSENGTALMDLSRVRAAHAAGVALGAEVAERLAAGHASSMERSQL